MTDFLGDTDWLVEGKSNLLRFKREPWLNDSDIQLIDRGIASLDRLMTALRQLEIPEEHRGS